MNDEQKYQGLEDYIRQGEPQQRERGEAWKVAIGLQQVDGLQTSEYLLDTARRHIGGDITIEEAKDLIDSYYKSADGRKLAEDDRTEEADKVSARITEILTEKTFSFTPAQLTSIHRRLFDGIYKLAGRIRDYNITKNEWVLGGKTVYYASAVQSAKLKFQSANQTDELSLKCKNCTLEEAAVLRIVQKNPTATQKEIAAEIGKSERTVKSITVNLQEKGVLQRVNGKRNGRWEINND